MELWNATTGEQKVIFSTPDIIFGIRYSPDGKSLAISTAAVTGRTFLWDTTKEVAGVTFHGPNGPLLPFSNDIAFSPDGAIIATSWGDDVMLWDAKTGESIGPLTGHTRMPKKISFRQMGSGLRQAARMVR